MSRRPTLADLKKKASVRLKIFLIFLIVWLIVDEWVKEGYIFDPSDILQPLTHEFLITLLLFLEAMFLLVPRLMKRKGGNDE